MAVEFKLLGTGAGPGVPAFYCDCIACQEARENPSFARTRSGALIDTGKERILIDASPDIRSQLIKERIDSLSCIFLTHWHYDHFGGLGDLEFYVRLKRKKPLKLYLPPSAVDLFQNAYPFLQDVFEVIPWQFDFSYKFTDLELILLSANHGIETAGIWLKAKEELAYFSDTCGLPDDSAKKINEIDHLVCDATFYGENWYPNSHMSIEQAIEFGEEVKARNIVLTHLAMHYSKAITVRQLEEEIKQKDNVELAYDGMVINI
ncbi:MAG: MBL fold metallo-hydrolase [Eubacteriales bacterium]